MVRKNLNCGELLESRISLMSKNFANQVANSWTKVYKQYFTVIPHISTKGDRYWIVTNKFDPRVRDGELEYQIEVSNV